ncbi:hypothetical protein VNO80_24266 [Phaseolus coccineus]|uniref:Uncharacterized protein n=1 Tax=Phaseolus coccineus TaxID=3886 RepID=A0AAN9LS72_PHACN
MESWGFRFEGYQIWCGFISLDQFRFKGRVIEGTQTFDLFSILCFFCIKSVVGRQGKDGLDREAMPTLLVTTKRRKSERRDLNPEPQPWQGYALPLSYFRQDGRGEALLSN